MDTCPMCNGTPTLLGTLGQTTWLRCRDCGWQWSADPAYSEDEDYPDTGAPVSNENAVLSDFN